jgi:hypothetical protein
MANYNLTGQKIKDTYPQLAQVNDSNLLVDGLGVVSPILTSSIINFPTEVSRSAAAAGFGGGGSLPSGVVSSSAQVVYSGITGVPSGIVSSSAQVNLSLATGTAANATSASFATTASFAANVTIPTLQAVTNVGSSSSNNILMTNPNGNQTITISGPVGSSGDVILRGNTDFVTTFESGGLFGAEVVDSSQFTLRDSSNNTSTLLAYIQTNQVQLRGSGSGLAIFGAGSTAATSTVTIIGKNNQAARFKDASIELLSPVTASIISASSGFIGNLTGNATTSTSASFATTASHALNVGLVSGGGVSSIKSADFLTATASVASNDTSIAIGSNARAVAIDALALGRNSNAAVLNSTAIGVGATVNGVNGVAIGRATVNGVNGYALGDGSTANGTNTVAIGIAAFAGGDESVSIGTSHPSSGNNSIAIGRRGSCTGDSAISIGSFTAVNGDNAIAIGASAQATTGSAVALGASVIANVPSYTTTRFLQLLNVSSSMGAFGFVDDTAAASGGVPLGGIYHLSGSLKIRMV